MDLGATTTTTPTTGTHDTDRVFLVHHLSTTHHLFVDLATKERWALSFFVLFTLGRFFLILKCALIGSPISSFFFLWGEWTQLLYGHHSAGSCCLASYDLPYCSDRMDRQSLVASIVSCRWRLSIRYDSIHVIPTRRKNQWQQHVRIFGPFVSIHWSAVLIFGLVVACNFFLFKCSSLGLAWLGYGLGFRENSENSQTIRQGLPGPTGSLGCWPIFYFVEPFFVFSWPFASTGTRVTWH